MHANTQGLRFVIAGETAFPNYMEATKCLQTTSAALRTQHV